MKMLSLALNNRTLLHAIVGSLKHSRSEYIGQKKKCVFFFFLLTNLNLLPFSGTPIIGK